VTFIRRHPFIGSRLLTSPSGALPAIDRTRQLRRLTGGVTLRHLGGSGGALIGRFAPEGSGPVVPSASSSSEGRWVLLPPIALDAKRSYLPERGEVVSRCFFRHARG
jgi:hypothetical protein